jgi:sortase A
MALALLYHKMWFLGWKRRFMARLERMFFKMGFALVAVWGAVTLHGTVLSRAAIAEFHENEAKNAGNSIPELHGLASGSEVSFASWSIKRVQAYKESLLRKVDAPLAVLRIPKIHLEVPVFNGTDDTTLNRGVGRIVGTAQLGVSGNLAIAGHRDGFFRGLKDVAQGDVIELVRPGQNDFYVIDGMQIVNPKDVSVLGSTPAPSLTLVTCFPFYFVGSAPQRYIVRASLRSSSALREGQSRGSISTSNKTNTKENEK